MRAVVLAGLIWLPLASARIHAQEPPSPVVLPPRVGVSAAPRSLTLDDAIRLTLEQNNDVSIARLETNLAQEDIRAAQGVFDPRLIPALTYQKATSASASAIGGAVNGAVDTDQFAGTLALEGRTPWAGGRYSVDFTSSRLKSGNQFARLNPQFPSSFGASYIQPLFRGRRIDAERRQILLARRAADLTDAQLTQVVMDQLTLVEEAYWNLVFAARNLEVQTQALAQAQAQVTSNERQSQGGTLAPIDVVEAATQASNFRRAVASAQQALTEAENRLKSLMAANRTVEIWNQALTPTDIADRPVPALTLEEAMQLAIARRPELAALDTLRAQNDIDQEFFRDQARPQVDLVGSYTLSGLAGGALTSTGNPLGGGASDAAILARLNDLSIQAGLIPLDTPPPPTGATVPDFFVGGYGASLSNILARRFPTALVQLQMDLPIGNTAARANIARSGIAATQIARRRQQLEQAIEVEVRNALQAVRSSQDRLSASSSARRNALEQYESERRRFESGISTVFLVLERQTALVTAQAEELRARADLNQAVAFLDRAVGNTLERHGVRVGG
jgi:HAE1 family hydrophobic/amphiphilic exporter-1